jgi:nicotinamidase-related amidase
MNTKNTAFILIGYQNDYFASDGILSSVIEESANTNKCLSNTLNVLDFAKNNKVLSISTPIIFTEGYDELVQPAGILKTIKDVQAFKKGEKGSKVIPEILNYGESILEIPGKRGLNAFSNTKLDSILKHNSIENVIMLGVVSSVCIDSTARSAFERGYNVTIISDCTAGRTIFEQDYYCENIFPIYANVINHKTFLKKINQ